MKTWRSLFGLQRGPEPQMGQMASARTEGTSRRVELERAMLKPMDIERMRTDPAYNDVFDDLLAFTGLSEDELTRRLLRSPETHFKSEFRWHGPKDPNELNWFYRCSYGYLFANAAHPYWIKLDFLGPKTGRILDYGAGVGNNVLTLAKKGFQVDYFEISILQSEFTRFRADRHGLKNISFLTPYVGGRFEPVRCIARRYAAIILKDVLEHVQDYPLLLAHLIDQLDENGTIVEHTEFDPTGSEMDVHLPAAMPLKQAMKGMRSVAEGIWRK